MKFKITTFVLALALTALSASTETKPALVQYLIGTSDAEPTHTASGLEATPLIPGQPRPLVTGFSKPNNNAFYLLNNSDNGAPLLPTSKEVALEGGAYFEFTVTPTAGHPLHLSELNFHVGHEGSRTLAIYFVVTVKTGEVSLTEEAQFGTLPSYEAIEAKSGSSKLPASARVDLASLPSSLSKPVTFRIYAYYELLSGPEIPSGYTDSIRLGEISLLGEVR